MVYLSFSLLALMCLGHITIWAAIWNRLHGVGLSYGICSWITAVLVALGATIPTALVVLVLRRDLPLFPVFSIGKNLPTTMGLSPLVISAHTYVAACWLALPYAVISRIWRRNKRKPPVHHFTAQELAFGARRPVMNWRPDRSKISRRPTSGRWLPSLKNFVAARKVFSHAGQQSLGEERKSPVWLPTVGSLHQVRPSFFPERNHQSRGRTGEPRDSQADRSPVVRFSNHKDHHFLLRLPGNESLMCEQVDVGVRLARLPKHLEGMTILLLSDLHFTGKIGLDYYHQVVEHTNKLQPDLIFVTGDILDRSDCIGDAATVLSELRAQHGVFFVLGNHDLRAGPLAVRTALSQAGLTDVGGRVVRLPVDGIAFLIAGNELPWLGPAPDFSAAVNGDRHPPLRLLLAHTPDQFSWAVRQGVDLMLAGHTHGGQICLPWLGPIIVPSAGGIRYAHGLHYRRPTAMYVTRGLAGEFPVRYFCPPELTRIILFSGNRAQKD